MKDDCEGWNNRTTLMQRKMGGGRGRGHQLVRTVTNYNYNHNHNNHNSGTLDTRQKAALPFRSVLFRQFRLRCGRREERQPFPLFVSCRCCRCFVGR